MSTFTWSAAPGAKESVKPSVLNIKFGDGYEQRVQDGINTMPRTWAVSFVFDKATIDTIETFLSGLKGSTSFTWTPPSGSVGKFIAESWDRSAMDARTHSLSASFREVFEP
jgi:phage-related protein